MLVSVARVSIKTYLMNSENQTNILINYPIHRQRNSAPSHFRPIFIATVLRDVI